MDKGPREQEQMVRAFKPQYRSDSAKGVWCRKRLSLQGSSEILGQARGDLLSWKSLAWTRRVRLWQPIMPQIGWEPSGESGLRETTVVEPEGAATGGCQLTALLVAGPLLG